MTRQLLHLSDREPTPDEAKLIRRMERLAKEWPEGYMLASMGGSLCLFRQDDYLTEDGRGLDQDKMLWGTSRIPNTGGDW